MGGPWQALVDLAGEVGPVERTHGEAVAELSRALLTFMGSIAEGFCMSWGKNNKNKIKTLKAAFTQPPLTLLTYMSSIKVNEA